MNKGDAERLGRALAESAERMGFGDIIRACYRFAFGACDRCDRPLGGVSPEKLCTECHAAIVLERAQRSPAEVEWAKAVADWEAGRITQAEYVRAGQRYTDSIEPPAEA